MDAPELLLHALSVKGRKTGHQRLCVRCSTRRSGATLALWSARVVCMHCMGGAVTWDSEGATHHTPRAHDTRTQGASDRAAAAEQGWDGTDSELD